MHFLISICSRTNGATMQNFDFRPSKMTVNLLFLIDSVCYRECSPCRQLAKKYMMSFSIMAFLFLKKFKSVAAPGKRDVVRLQISVTSNKELILGSLLQNHELFSNYVKVLSKPIFHLKCCFLK